MPRLHSLEVEQQPIRARMCGFGDKVTQSSDLPRGASNAGLMVMAGPETTYTSTSSQAGRHRCSNRPRGRCEVSIGRMERRPDCGADAWPSSIDFAQYVVTVDLWDETGTREVNLVRSTTATPAISSTIHESFNNLESMPYRAANIAPYPAAHPGQMTLYSQHQSPVNPYAPNQYSQGKQFDGRGIC